jgi:hypothetical protein
MLYPFVKILIIPLAIVIVPIVAIKALIFTFETSKPLTRPITTPVRIPRKIEIQTDNPESSESATIIPASPYVDPTDRSKPPVRRTRTEPIEHKVYPAIATLTASMLLVERNAGELKLR